MLPDCCRFANDAVRCPRKHVDVCPTMHLPTYASFVPLASRARQSSARGQRPLGDSRFVLCPSCGLRLRVHKCVRAFRVPPRRSSNSLTRNVVPLVSFIFVHVAHGRCGGGRNEGDDRRIEHRRGFEAVGAMRASRHNDRNGRFGVRVHNEFNGALGGSRIDQVRG